MVRVYLESPYAGDVEANVAYARKCMADCLRRGEAPYASHLLFTQPGILDDSKPEERKLGIEAGFIWGRSAEKSVFYVDRGMSRGMLAGVAEATAQRRPIEYRSLYACEECAKLKALGYVVDCTAYSDD